MTWWKSMHTLFDVTINDLSKAVCIDSSGITQTCQERDNVLDRLPYSKSIHVVDWKLAPNTTTVKHLDWIKSFLNNEVEDKVLHIGNTHHLDDIGICTFNDPSWPRVVEMLNNHLNHSVKLSILVKGSETISTIIKTSLLDYIKYVVNIIPEYRYLMVEYQDVNDPLNVVHLFFDHHVWSTNNNIIRSPTGELDWLKLKTLGKKRKNPRSPRSS